jgi:hypothetical protein
MEHRTDTVSFRLEPTLRRRLEAVALARETTVSDLIHSWAVAGVEQERLHYERLSAVFGINQDLSEAAQ